MENFIFFTAIFQKKDFVLKDLKRSLNLYYILLERQKQHQIYDVKNKIIRTNLPLEKGRALKIESMSIIINENYILIDMNRRDKLIQRIENLNGLINHLIRIDEKDILRGVRNTLTELDRELEGMKKTHRYN